MISVAIFGIFCLYPASFICIINTMMYNAFDLDNASQKTKIECAFGLVAIAVLMLPFCIKASFFYYRTFSYLVIGLAALTMALFVIGVSIYKIDNASTTESLFVPNQKIIILFLLPMLCFAYNLEIGVMPVHCSFNNNDKHGSEGLKASYICIFLVSCAYIIIFALSNYNVLNIPTDSLDQPNDIQTILSLVYKMRSVPMYSVMLCMAIIMILEVPLTFNLALE